MSLMRYRTTMNAIFTHVSNIIKLMLKFIVDFIVMISALIVVPIALLFVNEEDNHLPKWARWYETFDNDINGDIYWQGPEHANGKQRSYWWRLRWLFRNPIGTFSYEKMGITLTPQSTFQVWGDPFTGNIPRHEGSLYAEATENGKMYPCYYVVKQWGNTSKCFRLYLGYKFRKSRPIEGWLLSEATRVQFVFTISFTASYHD